MGGIVLWDRMAPKERRATLERVQREYTKLPSLPTAANLTELQAIEEGYRSGSNYSYQTERFKFRAVWATCELAMAVFSGPAQPELRIAAASTSKFSDCAAQTASRLIREMLGIDVEAAFLSRTFGLPKTALTYKDAMSYARHWFEMIGVKLSTKPGGFRPGGEIGKYVIFMRGGASGGHVVYGEVTSTGITIVDNQIGKIWNSLERAQAQLGMQATAAYRVEAVIVP